jgi:hypothetical protein
MRPVAAYETTILDRESRLAVSAFVIPQHTVPDTSVLDDPDLLMAPLGLDNLDVTLKPEGLVPALTLMLAGLGAADAAGYLNQDVPLPQPPDPSTVEFASYLAYSDSIPWEESPLSGKALATVMVGCLAMGSRAVVAGLGAFLVVLVCCTAGVIVLVAAGETATEALTGLRARIRAFWERP